VFTVLTEKPNYQFIELKQVHGTKLIDSSEISIQNDAPLLEADGFIISKKDSRAFAIKTADCVPLLLEGEQKVALIHAGWRGLKDGIHLQNSVAAIKPFRAYIGPHIRSLCYEVSSDFLMKNLIHHKERWYFDLTAHLKKDLSERYPGIDLIDTNECTHCNLSLHSFRRDGTDKRLYNIVRITP